ncbi:hypothetical protein ACIRPK_26485 [Kitasatospora sp. NPDC101801]|uniref:hypothetical protein n=1 Tax=Kitasatospora sp. NPDC101801 TaxID=3364103 RepID=UPI003815DD22
MHHTPAPARPSAGTETPPETEPTEVLLELHAEDGSDYRDRRLLDLAQLTILLLAFDGCEDDDADAAEATLTYEPAEYAGLPWSETRWFTNAALSELLLAFEEGEPI